MSNRKGVDLGAIVDTTSNHYRGPWGVGTTYVLNDSVVRGNALFIATSAPGAAGANDPAADPNIGTNSNISTVSNTGSTFNDGNFASLSYRFTPASNLVIAQVTQAFGGTSGTATIEVGIESGTITSDNVTPIGVSGSISIPASNGTAATFTFASPVSLTAGVQYRFVVRASTSTGFQTFSSASYTNGTTPNDARYNFSTGASFPNRTLIGRTAFYPWTFINPAGVVLRAVSTTSTLTWLDQVALCTDTITVTLPSATSGVGKLYTIKNTGTGTVTVTPASGTIDGAATFSLTVQYSSLDVVTDGTNWFTV